MHILFALKGVILKDLECMLIELYLCHATIAARYVTSHIGCITLSNYHTNINHLIHFNTKKLSMFIGGCHVKQISVPKKYVPYWYYLKKT